MAAAAGSTAGIRGGTLFHPVPEESAASIAFLPATLAEEYRDGPFIVIVQTREEVSRWLRDPKPGAEGLQVEGLIGFLQRAFADVVIGKNRLRHGSHGLLHATAAADLQKEIGER